MAIGTNDAIHKFGTQDVVDDTTTSAITNTSFSVAADITSWTNDDDAPLADMVLQWQYPSGTISAGAVINIYAQLMNIQSTNDAAVPDASNKKTYLGFFQIDEGLAATTDEFVTAHIVLPNTYSSQVYDFYLENKTGVTISANWNLWITPKTIGPHA